MGRRLALGRRVLGFTALPFISSLAPFLLLPILARRVTDEEWAGLGIGQSVGMVGAVAVTWGWQILGPVLVAGAERREQQGHYLDSLVIRGGVSLVLTPILAAIAGLVAPEGGVLLAVTMACAITLSGLTPAWYFVGVGKPSGIAIWDVAPRIVATLAAAAIVFVGGSPLYYPLGLIVLSLGAVVVLSVVLLRGYPVAQGLRDTRRARDELRRGLSPMATEMTLSLFSSGSVAFVGWRASTQTVAAYSSGYRLFRLAVYVVTALANALQGWVAEKKGAERGNRMVRTLQAHALIGVLGMVGIVALMPEVSTLLFGSRLDVDRLSSLFFGMNFLAASIGTSLARHVLIPEGATGGVLVSAVVGAGVGIPMLVLFAEWWGVPGAAAALFLSQLILCATVARRSVHVVRRLRATAA